MDLSARVGLIALIFCWFSVWTRKRLEHKVLEKDLDLDKDGFVRWEKFPATILTQLETDHNILQKI